MPARGAVDAAGAGRGRATPDALVRARAVAVLARRGMDAARTVRRRTAPLAVLLVVTMLVLPRRAVDATRPVARRPAMSAFRTHPQISLFRLYTIRSSVTLLSSRFLYAFYQKQRRKTILSLLPCGLRRLQRLGHLVVLSDEVPAQRKNASRFVPDRQVLVLSF